MTQAKGTPGNLVAGIQAGVYNLYRSTKTGTVNAVLDVRDGVNKDGLWGLGKGLVTGTVGVAQSVCEGTFDLVLDVVEGARNTPELVRGAFVGHPPKAAVRCDKGHLLIDVGLTQDDGHWACVNAWDWVPKVCQSHLDGYDQSKGMYRWRCPTCEEYDLCDRCYAKEFEENQRNPGALKELPQPRPPRILESALGGHRSTPIDGLVDGSVAVSAQLIRGANGFVNGPVNGYTNYKGQPIRGLGLGLGEGCVKLTAAPVAGALDFTQANAEGWRNMPGTIISTTGKVVQAGIEGLVKAGMLTINDGAIVGNMEDPAYVRALYGSAMYRPSKYSMHSKEGPRPQMGPVEGELRGGSMPTPQGFPQPAPGFPQPAPGFPGGFPQPAPGFGVAPPFGQPGPGYAAYPPTSGFAGPGFPQPLPQFGPGFGPPPPQTWAAPGFPQPMPALASAGGFPPQMPALAGPGFAGATFLPQAASPGYSPGGARSPQLLMV